MSQTDAVLEANKKYASQFSLGGLATPPARKLAVLACMDARLHIEDILGLKTGEAHIIRNAGAIASTDAIRSLLISHHLLGTEEFLIISHSGCGMLNFKGEELEQRLERETGISAVEPVHFHSFSELKENVRRQVSRVRSHPWIPETISVRGFIYDVKSGRLEEVAVPGGARLKAAG